MMNNSLAVNYTDAQLRVLVEEYITQLKSGLSLKGACDYVLYWAIEDGCRGGVGVFEGNALCQSDQERVKRSLESIALDGRIAETGEGLYERVKD